MDELYNKYEKLPKRIRDVIDTDNMVKVIRELKEKFKIDFLMEVIFLVATKELKLADLEKFLQNEGKMKLEDANDLSKELEEKVFKPILDYLQEPSAVASQTDKEDEKEIEDLKKKMPISKLSGIDKLVGEIIQKSALSFEDEILKKRFENIISARLKDVRDDIETKEVLIKAIKIGGLGLDDASADRVVRIIKDEFEKMDEKIKKELNLPKFELPKVVQPYPATPIAIEAAKPDEIISEPKVSSDKTKSNSLEKEISSILKENKLVGPDKSIKESAPVIKPEIETKKTTPEPQPEKRKIIYESFKLAPLKSSESKAVVEDITRPPKVMGPIEELKYLSLNVFRRLSTDPKEAILKIKQRIDVMEKESLAKKIQAIKAWRQSEVYKLYLEIGKESIEKNKETSQVVQERINLGKTTLTEREIEEIIELNKSLRF